MHTPLFVLPLAPCFSHVIWFQLFLLGRFEAFAVPNLCTGASGCAKKTMPNHAKSMGNTGFADPNSGKENVSTEFAVAIRWMWFCEDCEAGNWNWWVLYKNDGWRKSCGYSCLRKWKLKKKSHIVSRSNGWMLGLNGMTSKNPMNSKIWSPRQMQSCRSRAKEAGRVKLHDAETAPFESGFTAVAHERRM